MNLLINLSPQMRAFHVLTVSTSSEDYRYIAHPTLYILFFFMLFYMTGLTGAKKEKHIARRKLSPKLRRLLFLNQESYFTINTIFFQSYLIIITLISLFRILFINEANPNQVVQNYGNLMGLPFLVYLFFIPIKLYIFKKKERNNF